MAISKVKLPPVPNWGQLWIMCTVSYGTSPCTTTACIFKPQLNMTIGTSVLNSTLMSGITMVADLYCHNPLGKYQGSYLVLSIKFSYVQNSYPPLPIEESEKVEK